MSTSQPLPLAGIRVLDFTHVIAGPVCTMMLADAGAEVIKVEPPTGDLGRRRGGVRVADDGTEVSAFHAAYNRGKRGIVLDLKCPAGVELARRLATTADVVVENLAPGTMDRLGLSLEFLRAENPRLVTASISLFGTKERNSRTLRRGLSIIAEAESGLVSQPSISPEPINTGYPVGDHAAAHDAYAGIVTALLGVMRHGRGCHVDISMVRSLISYNGHQLAQYSLLGEPGRLADTRPAVYGYYRTRDGQVAIGMNSEHQWSRFVEAVDDPALRDPRFSSFGSRDALRDEVQRLVRKWTESLNTDVVLERLQAAGIPSGRVNDAADVVDSEEHRAWGHVVDVDDGTGRQVTVAADPLGFGGARPRIPVLGEETRDVLREALGLSDAELVEAAAAGAFGPDGPAIVSRSRRGGGADASR